MLALIFIFSCWLGFGIEVKAKSMIGASNSVWVPTEAAEVQVNFMSMILEKYDYLGIQGEKGIFRKTAVFDPTHESSISKLGKWP